ncbi:hypothetical protein RFI_29798 [Reticulomyxa filosa]|uniref:Uncharacterized protein n=1 Tax=Reticulomyxa filosa TaxID=46433 RepID=X6M143_RETFI|nr:hypothetical protein RFI_29798 [Reticulomyxa filosa]|eukprot:ETO07594.1 hypothetical protein RFI_29798 [Reticulomyxa filosa]
MKKIIKKVKKRKKIIIKISFNFFLSDYENETRDKWSNFQDIIVMIFVCMIIMCNICNLIVVKSQMKKKWMQRNTKSNLLSCWKDESQNYNKCDMQAIYRNNDCVSKITSITNKYSPAIVNTNSISFRVEAMSVHLVKSYGSNIASKVEEYQLILFNLQKAVISLSFFDHLQLIIHNISSKVSTQIRSIRYLIVDIGLYWYYELLDNVLFKLHHSKSCYPINRLSNMAID